MLYSLYFSGTATGTVPTTVLSYSDYISRPEEHISVLRFDRDEIEKACRVVVIDDSLYEPEESFNVTLSMPMGGCLGQEFPTTRITILPDSDDGKELSLFFSKPFLTVAPGLIQSSEEFILKFCTLVFRSQT